MTLLEDHRGAVADLLDALGKPAGADILRVAAKRDASLDDDELFELKNLRDLLGRIDTALDASGSATAKVIAIRKIMEDWS